MVRSAQPHYIFNTAFQIHRVRIDQEEMRTGVASRQPKEVSYNDAIADLQTRPIYIRRRRSFSSARHTLLIVPLDLQTLRWWVEQFVAVITQSTKRMPYGIRYLAREKLIWLRVCLQLLKIA